MYAYKLFAVAALLGAAASANAVTLVNGSFELSGDANASPQSFLELSAGSPVITGWTVAGMGVDLVGSNYWSASDGIQSVDLSRRGAGSISQSFATTAGNGYLVTFDLSGNPYGGVDDKISVLTFSGSEPINQLYSVTAVNSPTNMLWETYGFNFVATSAFSTLTFASGENSRFGPALDNVAIADLGGSPSAVPEASTWVMLVAGFGLVGASARKRRVRTIAA